MIVYLYRQGEAGSDVVCPMSGGKANGLFHDTDAGTAPMSGDDFVVEASDAPAALDGARRWLANWANEDESCVPDDLALVERGTSRKRYMALRVT